VSPETLRQILAVQRLEFRKRFLGKRSIPVYMLALIPLALFGGRMVLMLLVRDFQDFSLAQDQVAYAVLFRTLILRFVIFFGCVAVFVPLFRGDILDRSMHYYLLSPLKRSTLTLAKYLSGLATSLILFNGVTLATWCFLYLAGGPDPFFQQLGSVRGLSELAAYLLVTSLACVGYGAVFLAAGVLLKNPIVPALAILGWEGINALMPPLLKKISVIHYLESLLPVSIPQTSGIQILADPASPWVAIPGIVGLAILLVWIAIRRVEKLEILYGVE
jgi:ABC-type transport system involved in multi-copper enzyme maturation permease subunit